MLFSRLIESTIIGVLAGGWASCTYWEGASGIFLGVLGFLMSLFWLTVYREAEKQEPPKHRKYASPYKERKNARSLG